MNLKQTLKKYKAPYLFISPFFILFFVFQLIPVIWTVFISFTNWNGLGKAKWCGLDNYKLMIQDVVIREAVANTMIYWASCLVIIISLSLLIAIFLNSQHLKCKRFFQTTTYLPYVCASVAMGLIFGMLFDQNAGLINEILVKLGFERIPWLTSSKYALYPVIALFCWRMIPWFTIIIYSGLLNISSDYYEAATVDGAGDFKKFIYITLPMLKNILFFCGLTVTVNIWKMFNESYTLAGPGGSNSTLFQQIYEYGFVVFRLGYASSLSVLLIVILLIISIIQFIIKRRDGEV